MVANKHVFNTLKLLSIASLVVICTFGQTVATANHNTNFTFLNALNGPPYNVPDVVKEVQCGFKPVFAQYGPPYNTPDSF